MNRSSYAEERLGSRDSAPQGRAIFCALHTYEGSGNSLKIVRRIGATPRERGSMTGETCPDIFELSDGNFAVIGTEATAALYDELPPGTPRADYERIVVISRETLVRAKADIPDL